MFQDDFPEDKDNAFLKPAPIRSGSFRLTNVTPHSIALVNAVIDRSADFDRSLADTSKLAKDCPAATDANLLAYSDLIQAKGKLVEYIARLMDKLNDPNLNRLRTSQVRFK